jgi:hypothetical protein
MLEVLVSLGKRMFPTPSSASPAMPPPISSKRAWEPTEQYTDPPAETKSETTEMPKPYIELEFVYDSKL